MRQGLTGTLAGGGHNRGDIIARLFGGGGDGCADIAGGIAVEDGGGQYGVQSLGQIVAEIFDLAADLVVVENESGVVLENPQGFAGTIRVGVDYP